MKIIGKHAYRRIMLADNSVVTAKIDLNEDLGTFVQVNPQLTKFISHFKYDDKEGKVIKRSKEEIQSEISSINNINNIYTADTADYDEHENCIET